MPSCSVDGVAITLPNCSITRLYGLAPGQHVFIPRATAIIRWNRVTVR